MLMIFDDDDDDDDDDKEESQEEDDENPGWHCVFAKTLWKEPIAGASGKASDI